jgi:MarR family transcriptional regulator, transcriptional regulator for hemolysin
VLRTIVSMTKRAVVDRPVAGPGPAPVPEPVSGPGPNTNDLGWMLGTLLRSYLKRAGDAVSELPGGPRGYQVLAIAARGACRNQAGIAEHLGIDRTVMTYLLDDLEGAGLLERKPDPEDRRSRQIVLTVAGRRTLEELTQRVGQVEQHLLSGLSETDAARLRSLLSRAANAAADGGPGVNACSLDPAPTN